MTWAAVGAAAISVVGGLIGGSKAKKAAAKQAKVQKLSLQYQDKWTQQAREDNAPWRESGVGALGAINNAMGLTPSEDRYGGFESSPGYQFRMDEGVRALDRSASARGNLFSGAQGRALARYGQGYASNEFGNYMANLQSLAGLGQNSAAQNSQIAQNQGVNGANSMIQGGNARASGYLAQGQMAGNLAGIGADLFTRYQQNRNTRNANNSLDNYFSKKGNF